MEEKSKRRMSAYKHYLLLLVIGSILVVSLIFLSVIKEQLDQVAEATMSAEANITGTALIELCATTEINDCFDNCASLPECQFYWLHGLYSAATSTAIAIQTNIPPTP